MLEVDPTNQHGCISDQNAIDASNLSVITYIVTYKYVETKRDLAMAATEREQEVIGCLSFAMICCFAPAVH